MSSHFVTQLPGSFDPPPPLLPSPPITVRHWPSVILAPIDQIPPSSLPLIAVYCPRVFPLACKLTLSPYDRTRIHVHVHHVHVHVLSPRTPNERSSPALHALTNPPTFDLRRPSRSLSHRALDSDPRPPCRAHATPRVRPLVARHPSPTVTYTLRELCAPSLAPRPRTRFPQDSSRAAATLHTCVISTRTRDCSRERIYSASCTAHEAPLRRYHCFQHLVLELAAERPSSVPPRARCVLASLRKGWKKSRSGRRTRKGVPDARMRACLTPQRRTQCPIGPMGRG